MHIPNRRPITPAQAKRNSDYWMAWQERRENNQGSLFWTSVNGKLANFPYAIVTGLWVRGIISPYGWLYRKGIQIYQAWRMVPWMNGGSAYGAPSRDGKL